MNFYLKKTKNRIYPESFLPDKYDQLPATGIEPVREISPAGF